MTGWAGRGACARGRGAGFGAGVKARISASCRAPRPAIIQYTKPGRPATSPWLLNLLSRKPRKLAAVALVIKTARIVWAMMTSEQAYQPRPAAA